MKIKVNAKQFNNTLKKVKNGVAKKSKLAILESILLTATNSGVTLTSSDLEATICIDIDCTVVETGSIVINDNDIKLLEKLTGEIEIAKESDRVIYKTSRKIESKIIHEANDFPEQLPTGDTIELFTINALQFKNNCKIKKMTAKEETRPIFTGVAIQNKYMVSCDGYRIARINVEIDNEDNSKDIVIPFATIEKLEKLIDKKSDYDLKFSKLGNNYTMIQCDEFTVYTRLLEGEYLKTNQTYGNKEHTITLDKTQLIDFLEMAKIMYNNKKNAVQLYFVENKIEAFTVDETRILSQSIDIIKSDISKSTKAAFNPTYLLEALKMVDDKEVEIRLNRSEVSPIEISTKNNTEDHLVLPIRMTEWHCENAA